MPFDAMVLSAAVIAVFVVFAVVLHWGDLQTRPDRNPKSQMRDVATPSLDKAA